MYSNECNHVMIYGRRDKNTTMNILIIGNGFDIAHGLPTKYSEFLSMCKAVQETRIAWIGGKMNYLDAGCSNPQLDFLGACLGGDLYNEFQGQLVLNFWIEHFQRRQNEIGDKWLNFEKEIKFVIKSLAQECEDGDMTVKTILNPELNSFFASKNYLDGSHVYRELFEILYVELLRLDRALEIYLDGYINKLEINKLPYIADKSFECVLSFNYTDTYARLYNVKADCCYVHGYAKKVNSTSDCNLVLGFDDHYQTDDIIPELIPFQKYYQRIVKSTDTRYFKWVSDIPSSYTNQVYFYGHSMDPEDGDIIEKFIMDPHNEVIIYCLDQKDRAEKIKNLAIVLGPEKLIELCGSPRPKIRFEFDD